MNISLLPIFLSLVILLGGCSVSEKQKAETGQEQVPEKEDDSDPVDDYPNPYTFIVGGQEATGERIRMEHPGIANPERGFRFEMLVGVEGGEGTESAWPFDGYTDDGITVTQAYCYLTPYFDSDIAQSKLDALQKSFDRARESGVKFLLRFAYQDDAHRSSAPGLERILSHIEQLTPIVRSNIDVIYALQIGWVGMWGEFHSDPNFLPDDPKAVARIVDATLTMLPESRSTMMRRMDYRKRAVRGADSLGIRLDMMRVGFFNDGTLANPSDGGTFASSRDGNWEFDAVGTLGSFFPVDGECYWNSVATYERATAMAAIRRFYKHHYTTFSVVHGNSELERKIYGPIDCWKSVQVFPALLQKYGVPVDSLYFKQIEHPNGYEYIRDHLGYRIEVVSCKDGKVVLRNTGFSRPVNPRSIYLVLRKSDGSHLVTDTGVNARELQPWQDVSIDLAGLSDSEDATVALWLPDPEESLRLRPEYAITLAYGATPLVENGMLLNLIGE